MGWTYIHTTDNNPDPPPQQHKPLIAAQTTPATVLFTRHSYPMHRVPLSVMLARTTPVLPPLPHRYLCPQRKVFPSSSEPPFLSLLFQVKIWAAQNTCMHASRFMVDWSDISLSSTAYRMVFSRYTTLSACLSESGTS